MTSSRSCWTMKAHEWSSDRTKPCATVSCAGPLLARPSADSRAFLSEPFLRGAALSLRVLTPLSSSLSMGCLKVQGVLSRMLPHGLVFEEPLGINWGERFSYPSESTCPDVGGLVSCTEAIGWLQRGDRAAAQQLLDQWTPCNQHAARERRMFQHSSERAKTAAESRGQPLLVLGHAVLMSLAFLPLTTAGTFHTCHRLRVRSLSEARSPELQIRELLPKSQRRHGVSPAARRACNLGCNVCSH